MGLHRNYRWLLVASFSALPLNLIYVWFSYRFDTEGLSMRAIYFGRDFVNYWSGGHLASRSEVMTLYDIAAYKAWLGNHFAPEMSVAVFSYPPHMPVLLLPFGVLPHGLALLLWSVLGVSAFWLTCFYRTPLAKHWLSVLLIGTASAVLFNLSYGQLGLFLAAAFVGALRLLPTHPVLAGILIGLLTVKPQLGPLLVIVLLMRWEWRAIAAAAATSATLVLTSLWFWGLEPWLAYAHNTLPYQTQLLEKMDGFYALVMTTPFAGLYALGLPWGVAMTGQIIIALGVVIATVLLLRRKDMDWSLQVAVIAMGATLLSPYVLAYDVAIPLAALMWYISSTSPDLSRKELAIYAAVWSLCFSVCIVVQMIGFPLFPVLLCVAFAVLFRRASGRQHAR